MANILVLVSYKVFPAEMGGQKAVVNLYRYLAKHHKIHFAVSSDNDFVDGYSVERILFPHSKMLWNIFCLRRLKNSCRKHKIDLIIAEHSYTGWLAYLLKKITGIPFLIRSHNIEASRFRQMKRRFWRLYGAYEKWIHQKADFHFFISEKDKTTANHEFGLAPAECEVIPYAITRPKEIIAARNQLAEKFGIRTADVFYFNGTLDYLPNTIAVENILKEINPRLQSKGLNYTIVISGKNLPADLRKKVDARTNMVYVGFTEDVDLLYQSASVFLNPISNNSGIKTKLVEALANHCKIVSMKGGAVGISSELCGSQMMLAENDNWDEFAEKVIAQLKMKHIQTPASFFDYFSAEKIAAKAADKINILVHANT